MTWKEEKCAENRIVRFSGKLTISYAAEMRRILIRVCEDSRRVLLDMEQVEEADLYCLQLLCSLQRTASGTGGEVGFTGTVPGALKHAAGKCGFLGRKGCGVCGNGTCLWATKQKQPLSPRREYCYA